MDEARRRGSRQDRIRQAKERRQRTAAAKRELERLEADTKGSLLVLAGLVVCLSVVPFNSLWPLLPGVALLLLAGYYLFEGWESDT